MIYVVMFQVSDIITLLTSCHRIYGYDRFSFSFYLNLHLHILRLQQNAFYLFKTDFWDDNV